MSPQVRSPNVSTLSEVNARHDNTAGSNMRLYSSTSGQQLHDLTSQRVGPIARDRRFPLHENLPFAIHQRRRQLCPADIQRRDGSHLPEGSSFTTQTSLARNCFRSEARPL